MLHLDIEQVDKRAVLLVADVAFVEDPYDEALWIGPSGNLSECES